MERIINCERSELSSTFNGPEVCYIYIAIYIYIFQVDRHSVNVLYKCFYIRISIDSTITVYHLNPPNAIFRAIERTRKLAALAINNPFHVYSNNN